MHYSKFQKICQESKNRQAQAEAQALKELPNECVYCGCPVVLAGDSCDPCRSGLTNPESDLI